MSILKDLCTTPKKQISQEERRGIPREDMIVSWRHSPILSLSLCCHVKALVHYTGQPKS